MRARLLVALAAATALACGNKAEDARDELRRRCLALVPGTSTLDEARVAFQTNVSAGVAAVLAPRCEANRATTGGGDVCPYDGTTPVCIVRYEFLTTACSGPFAGSSCADYCDVRTTGDPRSATTVICGREFITNQLVLAAPGEEPPP